MDREIKFKKGEHKGTELVEVIGWFGGQANKRKYHSLVDPMLEEGIDKLLIDLTNTEYIDSSGANALVVTYKRMGEKGLSLICKEGFVKDILQTTGLADYLKIYDSIDDID
jgi:anti-anti-sigma factor